MRRAGQRGAGTALFVAFIVLAILTTLSLFQWFAGSVLRSRKRVKDLQRARWLAEMALDEFEYKFRSARTREEAPTFLRFLHGDGLSWEDGATVQPLRFMPRNSLEAARSAYGVEDPYDGRGVEILVHRQPLFPRPRTTDRPDESEGLVVAACTARHGEGTVTASRALEFRQTVASPPWGFDQCSFVALDWAYYRNRFQVFCRQMLRYLRERREFLRVMGERVQDKNSVLTWARNWAGLVRQRIPAGGGANWLQTQVDRNRDARRAFLEGIGYPPREDQIYLNLAYHGLRYFQAMERLGPVLLRYEREVLPEIRELEQEGSSVPRFRMGEGGTAGTDETFHPWLHGAEFVPWNEYVTEHLNRVFTLPDDLGWPAPIFSREEGPVDQDFFSFRNCVGPFEAHPELLDPGPLFACPPPVVNQIWAFDPEALCDGFRLADFQAWARHRELFTKACQSFLDHYRGEVERHEGRLNFANSSEFALRYAGARSRLCLDSQARRASYHFPTSKALARYLQSCTTAGSEDLRLDGVFWCAEAVKLGGIRHRGRAWICAPSLILDQVRAATSSAGEGLVLYGERGIEIASGGTVEAVLIAPTGTLKTRDPVEIFGALIVGGLGDGESASALSMRDEIAAPFRLRWDRKYQYVDPQGESSGTWDRRRSVLSVAPVAGARGVWLD